MPCSCSSSSTLSFNILIWERRHNNLLQNHLLWKWNVCKDQLIFFTNTIKLTLFYPWVRVLSVTLLENGIYLLMAFPIVLKPFSLSWITWNYICLPFTQNKIYLNPTSLGGEGASEFPPCRCVSVELKRLDFSLISKTIFF